MDKLFQIGSFCLRLTCREEIPIPENFLKFEISAGEPAFTYEIIPADTLPAPTGRLVARRPDLIVLSTPTGEARLIGTSGVPGWYGLSQETAPDRATVTVDRNRESLFRVDPAFVSLLALEKQLLARNSLVLHCAYMDHFGKAVLFSAPSETGKSTQAGLWQQHRGCPTLNGDRALLCRTEDQWLAQGWPVCGSSKICHNETRPIEAIVMLSQAPENTVVPLQGSQAFSQLFSQITVSRWNKAGCIHAMELVEDLLNKVPLYHLACDISENAVICLENALKETAHANG